MLGVCGWFISKRTIDTFPRIYYEKEEFSTHLIHLSRRKEYGTTATPYARPTGFVIWSTWRTQAKEELFWLHESAGLFTLRQPGV